MFHDETMQGTHRQIVQPPAKSKEIVQTPSAKLRAFIEKAQMR
jgi:hypothetical protein